MDRTKAIVITGASTGIGRACALHFDQLGYRVFAGVRSEKDGAALAADTSEWLTPVMIDVTDDAHVLAAARLVEQTVGERGVTVLVNNAGIAIGGPLEHVPLDRIRQQMDVNVIGAVAVTQAFLPLLRVGLQHSPVTVVNISSISGRMAMPFLGPYAASKFALEALSDSLRLELRPWNIRVVAIEPGEIATPIWEKGLKYAEDMRAALPAIAEDRYGPALDFMIDRIQPNQGMPAMEVARIVEEAVTSARPRPRYLVGRDARIGSWIARLPMRLRDRLIASRLPQYG